MSFYISQLLEKRNAELSHIDTRAYHGCAPHHGRKKTSGQDHAPLLTLTLTLTLNRKKTPCWDRAPLLTPLSPYNYLRISYKLTSQGHVVVPLYISRSTTHVLPGFTMSIQQHVLGVVHQLASENPKRSALSVKQKWYFSR